MGFEVQIGCRAFMTSDASICAIGIDPISGEAYVFSVSVHWTVWRTLRQPALSAM
jgi:hypothetical protein